MKKYIAALVLLGVSLSAGAENRLFENAWNAIPEKESVFKVGGEWFPYPKYEDRKGWDKFFGKMRDKVIENGDNCLDYKVRTLPATLFIDFEVAGNRDLMKEESLNRMTLDKLVLAELAEGQGRYLSKIIDILMYECTRYNWSHASHTGRQPGGRCLPTPEWHSVTLHSGYYAAAIAVAWHFFHKEFDKIDPVISRTIKDAIRVQIFEPYMSDEYAQRFHPWMGIASKTHAINNWNCTCNTDVFVTYMLMEEDQASLNKAIERIFLTFDNYLSYIRQDGCCDEGPSYWRMASGKFYEFSRYVNYASYGKLNVFGDPLLRKAAEFKSKTDLGDGWVMSYGDGGARLSTPANIMYRYGKDIENKEMVDYAIYVMANDKKKKFENGSLPYSEVMNVFEYLHYYQDLQKDQKKYLAEAGGDFALMKKQLRRNVTSVWYDQTQQAVLRNDKGWTLCCKGGTNDESHNHNDCGSCILFIDECPVLIDPGTAVYNKDTFGPNRYKLWHISSCSHNVPKINGALQQAGKDRKTSDVVCDPDRGFLSANIAGVYPDSAACQKWTRSYSLDGQNLIVRDEYALTGRAAPDEIRFTVRAEVNIDAAARTIAIESPSFNGDRSVKVVLSYPETLTPSVEVRQLKDKRLTAVWGKELKTIVLSSASDAPISGSYEIRISR